jgi:thioredoxin-like negative regulator of GroEL
MPEWNDDWRDEWQDDWENPNSGGGDPPRGGSRGLILGAGVVVLLVVVLVAGFLATRVDPPGEGAPDAFREGRLTIREVIEAEQAGVADDLLAQLSAFLDRLVEANLDDDEDATKPLFDHDRYLERMRGCGVITSTTPAEALSLLQFAKAKRFNLGYVQQRLIHVEPLTAPEEFLAYVYFSGEYGVGDLVRCWIVRTPRDWKLFDWELIEYGMPESVEGAILFEYSPDPRTDAFVALTRDVQSAYDLAGEGERSAALAKLRMAEKRLVHPKLRDNGWLRIAYAWSFFDSWTEAAAAARRISSPTKVPGAYYVQTLAHSARGDHEQTAEIAKRYEDVAGINPVIISARLDALEELSRMEEAVPGLRQWLRWDPENHQALVALGRALPEDQKQSLLDYLPRAEDPVETAISLAETFRYQEEVELLAHLTHFVEQAEPDSPQVEYLRGIREDLDGRFEQAAERYLAAARSEQDEEQRSSYLNEYIESMVGLNRVLEAYESLTDKRDAFQRLAEWIDVEETDDGESVRKLIEAHGQIDPDDPQLRYQRGLQLAAEEQIEAALEEFEALAEADDEELVEMARYQRIHLLLQADRMREAYESVDPSESTFAQVARRLESLEKPDELRELVVLHRAKFPDDEWLGYFEGVALMLDGKHSRASAVLERARQDCEEPYLQGALLRKRCEASLEASGVLSTYRLLGSSPEVFQQMSNYLTEQKRWDELRLLLMLHERSHPADSQLIARWAQLLWHEKNYPELIRRFSALPSERMGDLGSWQTGQIEKQVLRAYLRTDRIPEAVAFAEARSAESDHTELLLIAQLAAGNVSAARDAFKRVRSRSYLVRSVYDDEDVGHLLETEPFRSLREEFPPPVPYNRGEPAVVLLLDEVPSLDAARIRELASPVLGEAAEVIPLEGHSAQVEPFLIRSDDASVLLTIGRSSYVNRTSSIGSGHDVVDPALRAALREHQGWISLGIVSSRRLREEEQVSALAYQMSAGVRDLLDDHCRAAHLPKLTRFVPSGPELTAALREAGSEDRLMTMGESIWLNSPRPSDPEAELATRRCQQVIHRFARAFAGRNPDQAFRARIVFRVHEAQESHWVRVDRIEKGSYGYYRLRGTLESSSRLFPELAEGRSLMLDRYDIAEWEYRDGDEIIQAVRAD